MHIGDNQNDTIYFSRQWRLESCYGPKLEPVILPNGPWSKPMKTHYDRCCLSPGKHTISCINEQSTYGWGNAYLEIDGERYCDDFIGFKSMRTLFVQGREYEVKFKKVKTGRKPEIEYTHCNLRNLFFNRSKINTSNQG